jgi:hypothetical protein
MRSTMTRQMVPTRGVPAGAAAHSVNFDLTGRWVVAMDVGADHIYVFPFDANSRTLGNGKSFPTPPGKAIRLKPTTPETEEDSAGPLARLLAATVSLSSAFLRSQQTEQVQPHYHPNNRAHDR